MQLDILCDAKKIVLKAIDYTEILSNYWNNLESLGIKLYQIECEGRSER
jgi:hypothetical protein